MIRFIIFQVFPVQGMQIMMGLMETVGMANQDLESLDSEAPPVFLSKHSQNGRGPFEPVMVP
jgi:hypothetical protein